MLVHGEANALSKQSASAKNVDSPDRAKEKVPTCPCHMHMPV